MGAYGIHSTRYGALSNEQLYSMYRESSYVRLSTNEKLDLLQETVNRDASERGEVGAPEVRFANLPVNVSGNAANGIINVNYDMAVKGVQTFTYADRTIQHNITDYNIQSLNTVLHENTHCFQEQIIDGTITIDNTNLIAEYQANAFTATVIHQNGTYQLGCQYLTGETPGGYYMYYFQPTERDAYLYAEVKTASILNSLSEKYGAEETFDAYEKSVDVNGFQAKEQEAIQVFQNSNFVSDLNQTLQNQYFGTNVSVNVNTEAAVKAEMAATYGNLQQNISINKEDIKMSFDPNPVSLHEYNQSLRDTVNAYYEYAMNATAMSKGDAIQDTAEMSERYLSAVQEFQDVQNMQNSAAVSMDIGDFNPDPDGAMESITETGGIAVADAESEGIDESGVDNDDGIDI